jgi:predicted DNA binding protein
MSVLLEFTIDGAAFHLGRVLAPPPGMVLELERIVPTGSMLMPFVWATGGDYRTFEESVRSNSAVKSLIPLDRFDDQGLYRLEWDDSPTDLITAFERSGAAVLEARGDDTWEFRLRFSDHEALATFHDTIREMEIPIRIERTCTLPDPSDGGAEFDLTPEQREALVLAVRRGYFESPSAVQLDDLAGEVGISRQALSKRLRHGNEKILEQIFPSAERKNDRQ